MEGPVISASKIAVLCPRRFISTASIDATRDLPTPPLPLIMPITFLTLLLALSFTEKSVCFSFLSLHSLLQALQF